MTVTCLVKMTAVFFQSIGKSIRAVIASLIRDIVCFVPLVLILCGVLENKEDGLGINGILSASEIAYLSLDKYSIAKKRDKKSKKILSHKRRYDYPYSRVCKGCR